MMGEFESTCRRFDRDPADIEISTTWVPQREDGKIDAYAEAGVDRLIVPMAALAERGKTTQDQVKKFCDEVMGKLE